MKKFKIHSEAKSNPRGIPIDNLDLLVQINGVVYDMITKFYFLGIDNYDTNSYSLDWEWKYNPDRKEFIDIVSMDKRIEHIDTGSREVVLSFDKESKLARFFDEEIHINFFIHSFVIEKDKSNASLNYQTINSISLNKIVQDLVAIETVLLESKINFKPFVIVKFEELDIDKNPLIISKYILKLKDFNLSNSINPVVHLKILDYYNWSLS